MALSRRNARLTAFGLQVQDALVHLSDLAHLQTHPLVHLLPDVGKRPGGQALQSLLVDACAAELPSGFDRERLETIPLPRRVLVLRYLEGLPVAQVCQRLSIGRNEYYRVHRHGIDGVIERLAERLGVSVNAAPVPLPQPLELHPEVGTADGAVARAAPVTRLIGREREIAELEEWLAGGPAHRRLLTLTGMGGCGKTSLADRVAADLVQEYPDGVWLIDLAPLLDPALVAQTVATALGVRERSHEPIHRTVIRHLSEKHLLLVLDNCEHVIASCAEFTEAVLHASPHVQILATSREAMRIPGETIWFVPTLVAPGEGASLDQIARSDAVQLFVERVQAIQKTFALTPENAAAIGEICRRLDGLPLAIELAAARVWVLSVDQVLGRLDDRFRLLTEVSRTAVQRQQTMRATIDWSYRLLTVEEQTLLRQLAAFAGGWTLVAAEAVGAGAGTEAGAVLDLLTGLVNKSLVVAPGQTGGQRYRFLETIRQYAAEKLREAGEEAAVRDRHRDWYNGMVERAERELLGPKQLAWLAQIDAELDNLRIALTWSLETDASAGLQLAARLWPYWLRRGSYREGTRWLSELLARAPQRTLARGRALVGLGLLWHNHEDLAVARATSEEGLAVAREVGDRWGSAVALGNLGAIARSAFEYGTAEACYEEGLGLFQEVGDQWGASWVLRDLGGCALDRGELTKARTRLDASLDAARRVGERRTLGTTCCELGRLLRGQRDFAGARAALEEAVTTARAAGIQEIVSLALIGLGDVARLEGALEEARGHAERALQIATELGQRRNLARVQKLQGDLLRAHGDYSTARILLQDSLRLRTAVGNRGDVIESIEGLAGVAVHLDEASRGVELFSAAAAIRDQVGTQPLPTQRAEIEPDLSAARDALSPDAFGSAWARGHAMTLEQAIAMALSEDGA